MDMCVGTRSAWYSKSLIKEQYVGSAVIQGVHYLEVMIALHVQLRQNQRVFK